MSALKKNLLEAFRDAGRAELPGSTEPGPFDTPSPASGEKPEARASETSLPIADEPRPLSPEPVAHVPEPERILTPPPPYEPAPQHAVSAPPAPSEPSLIGAPAARLPRWVPLLAGVGLAFVLGILLGRGDETADASELDPAATGGDESSAATDRAGLVPGLEGARTERGTASGPLPKNALFDAANEYTVVVAAYGETADTYAWATHDHLADAGLPVFPPLEHRDKILILVGAAAKPDLLAETKRRVQALARDGRTGVYEDAYLEKIDRLVDR